MSQRITKEEFVAEVMKRLEKEHSELPDYALKNYKDAKDYAAWVACLLQADYIFNACNTKDLAGMLSAGIEAITAANAHQYFESMYDDFAEEHDEFFQEAIEQAYERIRNATNSKEPFDD